MEIERPLRDKNILITGGLGFIGSNLAYRLVEFGANVVLVDSLIPGCGGNKFNIEGIKNKVKVAIADVRDRCSMNYLVKDQDCIFNLAGTLSHINSLKDPCADLELNCHGQLAILEACRENNTDVKIVFAGTRGQYGRARYLPVDEAHPLEARDINGINKTAAEMYHNLYYKLYGIRTVSLRLTNTYGPRHQMRYSMRGIINWFIRQALDDETIDVYGDGEQIRDLNYADDVIDALILAMVDERANGEVFNLGGFPVSLGDVAKLIVKISGKGRYRTVAYPGEFEKIEIGNYIADYSKIKNLLGWQPSFTNEEGIRKTIDYYLNFKEYYW